MTAPPRVAVVVPNYNGERHLDTCLESLAKVDYPKERREVFVIDNGSVDESVTLLRERHPWARVHENGANLGFSAACNLGAKLAGDVDALVFLNTDMRVAPEFLREIVKPIVEGRAQAASAKILSWDGRTMNFSGGGMNFQGIGFQKGLFEEPKPAHDLEAPTLFACGGAMAIARPVFDAVGGFDDEFFAYYEDVDLGWRLWVLGHRVLYAPKAVCYHHHSSTSRAFPPEQIRLLQVRNPLLTIFKNYGDAALERVLAAALLLVAHRAMTVSGIDPGNFRIEATPSRPIGGAREVIVRVRRRLRRKLAVPRLALADLVALADVGNLLPKVVAKRRWVQDRRRRPDSEILPLFEDPFWCVEPRDAYLRLQETVQDFFRIRELFEGKNGSKP